MSRKLTAVKADISTFVFNANRNNLFIRCQVAHLTQSYDVMQDLKKKKYILHLVQNLMFKVVAKPGSIGHENHPT